MSFLRRLAAPLGPLYAAAVKSRNLAFDRHPERAARVEAPVVSLGNLSTGGTGKTPLALYLAQRLQAEGWANAIVSRGYGGRRALDPMEVAPDSKVREVGDEPLMMAQRLGAGRVVVARRRHAGALRALALEPKPALLLLDDGFQHRGLHRDVDLLLLDGVRRWGEGRMLPSGDLRESMEGARRAHALVVTRGARAPKDEVEAWWGRYGSGGPLFFVDFRIGALRLWNGEGHIVLPAQGFDPFLAFCGLGHPESFYADLIVAGLGWVDTLSFPDHAALTPRRLMLAQMKAAQAGGRALVCTEKDAVKLDPAAAALLQMPLWIAEQEVVGGEPLAAFVAQQLASLASGTPREVR
ncbi:MAG: tetraacyldisaccharide 4'-kinase [Holophagaceae bacterium]|nr:tetraacyldisaccharide 4'-kinase [Holophagaceae bacterium]